jgi:hypothetical protein
MLNFDGRCGKSGKLLSVNNRVGIKANTQPAFYVSFITKSAKIVFKAGRRRVTVEIE